MVIRLLRSVLPLLFFVLMAFVSENTVAQQRNPVLEYCTGTWCPWCPCGHEIINNDILPNYPNAIILGYHYGDEFAGFYGSGIMNSLGFSSYPTGIADRTSAPVSRSQWYSRVANRNTVPATVDITYDKSWNASSRTFSVTVNVSPLTSLDGEYLMHVVLTEEGLTSYQAGNSSCTGGSNYRHSHIVRAVMNGQAGTVLNATSPWNPGTTISKTVTYSVDAGFDEEECHVAVLVGKSASPLSTAEIQQAVEFELLGGASYNIFVNEGWNMISVPNETADMTVSSLFPSSSSNAFAFNNGYVQVEELDNGIGYWLKFDGQEGFDIQGTAPTGDIQLNEGWNLIGPYNVNVATEGITTNPSGIIASQFFEFNGAYATSSLLQVGKGYWVKASASGTMSYTTLAKKGANSFDTPTISEDWGTITITDAAGNMTRLYAANGGTNVEMFELPPAPPAEVFDARFTSGSYVETFETPREIVFNAVQYPVVISVNNTTLELKDVTGGSFVNTTLSDGNEIVISNESVNRLSVNSVSLPSGYVLEQNYPNPFNPTTTIKFAVSEKANVNLSVFNLLGQKVTEIFNGEVEAGSHEAEFKADNLSSGVYIYTLKVNEFTTSRKMTILK